MFTETILLNEGMKTLVNKFGCVEAERFIALILREPFDYTKWRHTLLDEFDDMSIEELSSLAMESFNSDTARQFPETTAPSPSLRAD